MATNADDFFDDKRPWSIIKDQVLRSYLPSYLAKVNKLGKPILIVDGFAGPGKFEDGSEGSPLIICSAAESFVPGKYRAFFINKDRVHHEKLTNFLLEANLLEPTVTPILGDAVEILPNLRRNIRDHTVFLYLDPFGPTGSPFHILEPFLTRDKRFSTEIVLMMHMPIVHRLAARNAVLEGREYDTLIQQYHTAMTETFGGEYWKSIMLDDQLSPEEREFHLINAYKEKLSQYLPFVGSCPVRASRHERIKYFIVFASRHPDAMLLMNDSMAQAYSRRMHEVAVAGTFFEKSDWQNERNVTGLREAVLAQVERNPGLSRINLWLKIVQANFMLYLEKEYRQTVQQLVDEGVLFCPTPRPTKRLNDQCELFVSTKQTLG